jgi:hypothetical protein
MKTRRVKEIDNYQALGYLLLACKNQKIDKETARELMGSMNYMFDLKTEVEAGEQGFHWLRRED